MACAAAFFLFSAYCAFAAFYHRGPGWLLLWPAMSFALVGFAYAGLGGAVFGKRPDGRRSWWAYALAGPFLLVNAGLWHLQRLLSRERCYDAIAPGLWIGRRAYCRELPPEAGLVVDLAAEFPAPREVVCQRRYIVLPTLDATPAGQERLRDLVEVICQTDDGVYIHCAQGHGRSAMVAAAVLMRKGLAASVQEAEAILRRQRPRVRLNRRQRRQVRRLAASWVQVQDARASGEALLANRPRNGVYL